MKDVESARSMYNDEDGDRRGDRKNAVLDIPLSDFELSVRSRNCLKKMNLRTLGDLLRTSEQELLSYKNFGEPGTTIYDLCRRESGQWRILDVRSGAEPDASLRTALGAGPVAEAKGC